MPGVRVVLTITDLFAGAGGSTTGATQAARDLVTVVAETLGAAA